MVRLLICVNILRLSHFRTCLWHFSLRRTWPTWAFHYSAHVYMFSDVLAPRPHSMSFYIKNTHMKLYGFFDELSWWSSSPRPQSTSNLQKILDWIIFALALGADGPCAQVNSFRWHWLGSGGTPWFFIFTACVQVFCSAISNLRAPILWSSGTHALPL